jgi:hypothetical protein
MKNDKIHKVSLSSAALFDETKFADVVTTQTNFNENRANGSKTFRRYLDLRISLIEIKNARLPAKYDSSF